MMQKLSNIDPATLDKLAKVRCWLLDMDGTVSLEDDALPGADQFFASITDSQFIFLTNNSSRHEPANSACTLSVRLILKEPCKRQGSS
jgi:ribonucleotide monophosphatase NagD (HAD superfamily)